ncbi:hypothetical protein [Leifsonia sp. P73]|uniref:hypothetical protein n=1 Tax=Leifsonia sp. P73 TaxID=3423959 RepID=UPI003DA3CE53
MLGSYTLGSVTAWATYCSVPLPADWAADRPDLGEGPGDLSLWVHQQGCVWSAAESYVEVRALPALTGTPRILDAPACSMVINADGLTVGAFVTPVSDRADLMELGGPQRVTSSQQRLRLPRRLHDGEHVVLAQTGCGAQLESPKFTVQRVPLAPVGIVGPVRGPHRAASFKNLVVGGRLHISVGGTTVVSVEINSSEMRVDIPVLRADEDQTITVIQEVCGEYSLRTSATVQRGEMNLSHTPSPVIRGTHTPLTVTATDKETGAQIAGDVFLGGMKVAETGSVFALTVPATGMPPQITVRIAEYQDATLTLAVADPQMPPPADVHAWVVSDLANIIVDGATWTLFAVDLQGGLTTVEAKDGSDVRFVPPTHGNYAVSATVSVTTPNGQEIALFEDALDNNVHKFNWSGQALKLGYKILWESSQGTVPTQYPVTKLFITQ